MITWKMIFAAYMDSLKDDLKFVAVYVIEMPIMMASMIGGIIICLLSWVVMCKALESTGTQNKLTLKKGWFKYITSYSIRYLIWYRFYRGTKKPMPKLSEWITIIVGNETVDIDKFEYQHMNYPTMRVLKERFSH